MKLIKNMVLISALSFVLASNAFAITVSIFKDNFDWKNIKQTQMGAVKKAPVNKVSAIKAPVNKVSSIKAPVNKVSSIKAPLNKVSALKAPVNKVSAIKAPVNKFFANKAPYYKVPYIQAPENKEPEIDSPDLGNLDNDSQDINNFSAFSVGAFNQHENDDNKHDNYVDNNIENLYYHYQEQPSSVPVPAALPLMASALVAFVISRRNKVKA